MATSIRVATLDDVDNIVEMGRDLHRESPRYRMLSFNAAKVEGLARRLLTGTMTTSPVGGVFVSERDGKITGMAAGYVTAHWFSDDRVMSDYTVYVRPDYRKTSFAFARLVLALEAWGCEQGARFSMIGVSTGIDSIRTKMMYERMGYRVSGDALLKEL